MNHPLPLSPPSLTSLSHLPLSPPSLTSLSHLLRLWGERVNLREQHDAFEFFNCLVDNLDEGLKTFSYSPVLSEVLGGAFADQKICKGCPHRSAKTEHCIYLLCLVCLLDLASFFLSSLI